jgi:hypothetical protein
MTLLSRFGAALALLVALLPFATAEGGPDSCNEHEFWLAVVFFFGLGATANNPLSLKGLIERAAVFLMVAFILLLMHLTGKIVPIKVITGIQIIIAAFLPNHSPPLRLAATIGRGMTNTSVAFPLPLNHPANIISSALRHRALLHSVPPVFKLAPSRAC